jgi:1-acyl-sn-glycerol-3-phosphate acyltransferase
MAQKAKGQPNRKLWFKAMKKLMVGRYKEPRFIYLGDKFQEGSIIVSNHEGTDAPLSLELYCDQPLRMWGAAEMNSGLVPMYKYQTQVYYHEKKHWNIHAARAFCLLASPLTNIFYRGLNLISTYHDVRFRKTLRESIEALRNGESVVIFPEDSKNGYLPELEGFFAGFVMLAEVAFRKGLDVPIYVTYFKKKELIYVIDAPVKYSTLRAEGLSRDEIAARLLARCNELGRMTFDKVADGYVADEAVAAAAEEVAEEAVEEIAEEAVEEIAEEAVEEIAEEAVV